ncbi:S-layer family protein [Ruminiclostridium sufflavum DSM 19573]|uniref:S-layer family protein n=1 Tax=Ruminiclostridium sufflavum DSM 19573 TaxID=1121337 RepID=A0A318YAM2_9FIRM|nr:S-layer homology domain-containing protein [Ruminiclostridium sufflavum]PYG89503.1 S-layer family protein [Ruminiclostridium sufflavum DSM 19573]
MIFLKLTNQKNKHTDLSNTGKKLSEGIIKTISAVLCTALISQIGFVNAAVSDEQVSGVYTSAKNGQAVINNLKYTDISKAEYDLKDAVYQNGALGIFPSPGSTKFNPNGSISKEMALYLVYMAANRAQDIASQGQTLNDARTAAQKKTGLQAVLYDGSLQLAANDGLITLQNLADALQTDQSGLDAAAFKRSTSVTRQEFATWLAKALMLPPVYNQQELFNSYSDWKSAKAENVPYIEAILENNIMSGDGKGNFNPNQAITRSQAARILKNAENVILPLRGMEKRTATIEEKRSTKDTSKGYQIDYNTYYVRNSDGLLDSISVEAQYQKPTTTTNEITGNAQVASRTEIPVCKNGNITNSSSLSTGDRIEYIAGLEDKTVYYARVLSSNKEIGYKAAIINSVNTAARSINITPLKQEIEYPNQEVSEPKPQTYSDGSIVYENKSYSNGVINALTKSKVDVSSIKPGSVVIIGINQDMIVEITPVTVKKEREQGLVAGIVEENNPQLGYLTLYNEDGTGKTPLEASTLRTFNYADPNDVKVYKNHVPAELSDIEPGDTVFVRIDDEGAVSSISGVPNYSIYYGKIVNMKISSVTVETEKGKQLIFNTNGVDVIKDGKLTKISQLKNGDKVKLIVNNAPNISVLKEIVIEGGDRLVANVYKGIFESYDDLSNKIMISNPWVLTKGQWMKNTTDPFMTIAVGNNFKAFFGGNERAAKTLNTLLSGTTVYIASEKDYGNGENGVVASFIDDLDKEVAYNDKVYNTASSNNFTLGKALERISFDNGTIVVKDGRLVQGSSVTADDYAYVMANRDSETGKLVAGVVSIENRPGTEAVQLYRGRISSIDEYKSVTLQSYAKLDGVNWNYANTPMTFNLTADTRITDTDGIAGQGDFSSYSGASTFYDRTIYILSDGTNAVEISTAPYGSYSITGEVTEMTGGTTGDDGNILKQPDGIALRNCKYYDAAKHLWVSIKDSKFVLLTNSLVIKNNKRINPSELKKGDKIKVLKKDNTVTGDAYIVIVEE